MPFWRAKGFAKTIPPARLSARQPAVRCHASSGIAEVDRLFEVLEERARQEHPSMADVRLLALVELLYGSGLRATELVSLPRRAIHPDRPFLILKGKGGRERLVPVSDRARQAVATWSANIPAGSLWLFPSANRI